jgi:Papain-like cysteine protease AvrRpt2
MCGMSVSLDYPVPLIPQPDKPSCWAGSMAMLVSYRRNASISPENLANEVNRTLRTSYGWDMLEDVKSYFGFQDVSLPSNTSLYPLPQQWYDWMNQYGPLWVTIVGI